MHMPFDVTLPQDALEHLLRTVGHAVAARPNVPVLASTLLQAQEDASTLTAVGYDLSLGVRASTGASVAAGGVVAVPFRLLSGLVGRLPAAEPVRLHLSDDSVLAVESGEGRYSITLAADASDYPALPRVVSAPVAVPWGPLRQALATAAHAASAAEAKPELQGVHLALEAGELRVEAIDGAGHRAVFVRLPELVASGGDAAFTVPSAAVRELLRLDVGDDELVQIGQDGGVAVFTAPGGVTLVSNLLDGGAWPPMYAKLPPKYKVSLVVNRDDLMAAVGRAQVIADAAECVIALHHTAEAITVATENDLGSVADPVPLEEGSTAATATLLFRSKYLVDALKYTEGTLVTINYVKAGTLAIIEPHGSALRRYLVMGLAPKP